MIWETNVEDHCMDVSVIASVGIDLGKAQIKGDHMEFPGPAG
jgi:hypothetical protein